MNFYKFPVTDIPETFLPHQQGTPFQHCIDCHRYLLDQDVEYVIEKAIRRYKDYHTVDVIFEYAMCLSCAEKMRKELSAESLQRIQQYIQNSNLLPSRQKLIDQNNWNIQDWISRCAISGKQLQDQDEYQIFAHCRGDQLVFSAMPYMISGSTVEEMSGLLSAQTRDELNRFIDDNFGIPPELKQPIKDHPIILF